MGNLPMWVLYAHPVDFPDHFVARKWLIVQGEAAPVATPEVLLADDLAPLRRQLHGMGLMAVPRFSNDEPQIVEVWI